MESVTSSVESVTLEVNGGTFNSSEVLPASAVPTTDSLKRHKMPPIASGNSTENVRPVSDMAGCSFLLENEDKWVRELANYEAKLEDMASASLDQNFKDELAAIEQWFRLLSETERTAVLYSLMQGSTPVQIRFFSSVLQQLEKQDPMNAVLYRSDNDVLSMKAVSGMRKSELNISQKFLQVLPKAPTANKDTSAAIPGRHSMPVGNEEQALGIKKRPESLSRNVLGRSSVGAQLGSGLSFLNHSRSSADMALANYSRWALSKQKALDSHCEYSRPKSAVFPDGSWPSETAYVQTNSHLPVSPTSQDDLVVTPKYASQTTLSTLNQGNGPRWRTSFPEKARERPRSGTNPDGSFAKVPLVERNIGNGLNATAKSGSLLGRKAPANIRVIGHEEICHRGSALVHGSPMNSPMMSPMHSPLHPSIINARVNLNSGPPPGLLNPPASSAKPDKLNFTPSNLHRHIFEDQVSNDSDYISDSSEGRAKFSARAREAHNSYGWITDPKANRPSPPQEPFNPELLKDVPKWLRSLRLHKYTPLFQEMSWVDIIKLSDEGLEKKGVAALGARRKFLKVFEAVKKEMGIDDEVGSEKEEKEPNVALPT